jgi:hypothetical protein
MATGSLISRIREGMDVRTSDNIRLGKIVQVWIGSDPANNTARCDEELCSRLQVRHRDEMLYIPYSAIGNVDNKTVVLNVNAAVADEHDWTRRPLWIPASSEIQTLGRTNPLHT